MARERRIFLDTNAIISLLSSGKLGTYQAFPVLHLMTFEKCIYEWKNGLKKYFIDMAFLSTRTNLCQAKVKFEKFIFKLLPTAAKACLTV